MSGWVGVWASEQAGNREQGCQHKSEGLIARKPVSGKERLEGGRVHACEG